MTRQEFINLLVLLNDEDFNKLILMYKGGNKVDSKYLKVSTEKLDWKKIPYEEWIKDVNPNYLNDNYDLETAYKYLPIELLEKWKLAINSDKPEYYLNYFETDPESGEKIYPYHLSSVAPYGDGDYIFLKKGTEETNPEIHWETDTYKNGSNPISKTHDLIFDGELNRYFYKKAAKKEQGGAIKQIRLCKTGGSLIELLKEQLGDSEIIDLLQHFGIDELMEGGLKDTSSMQIQIVIEGTPEEDDGGHKAPELELIEVGDKKYRIETVTTEADMEKGLADRDSLEPDMGMLFDFGEVQNDVTFNMEDMKFNLDIVFINDDDEVIKVARNCKPGHDLFTCNNVRYVLEVNANSEIAEGDEVEIGDCSEDKTPVMKVLAPDGSTLMELQGGERIFSRKNTKTLIKMAKRAEESKSNTDYKKLGNKMFKYIHTLDTNKPEYVEVPEN